MTFITNKSLFLRVLLVCTLLISTNIMYGMKTADPCSINSISSSPIKLLLQTKDSTQLINLDGTLRKFTPSDTITFYPTCDKKTPLTFYQSKKHNKYLSKDHNEKICLTLQQINTINSYKEDTTRFIGIVIRHCYHSLNIITENIITNGFSSSSSSDSCLINKSNASLNTNQEPEGFFDQDDASTKATKEVAQEADSVLFLKSLIEQRINPSLLYNIDAEMSIYIQNTTKPIYYDHYDFITDKITSVNYFTEVNDAILSKLATISFDILFEKECHQERIKNILNNVSSI